MKSTGPASAKNSSCSLQRTMMMGTRLCVRMNGNRPCPDFFCTDLGTIDRCGPVHPWRLRSIAFQRVMPDHPDAFVAPILALIHLAHLASSAWLPGLECCENPELTSSRPTCSAITGAGWILEEFLLLSSIAAGKAAIDIGSASVATWYVASCKYALKWYGALPP